MNLSRDAMVELRLRTITHYEKMRQWVLGQPQDAFPMKIP